MNDRLRVLVAALVPLAVLVAACGSGTASTTPSPGVSPAASSSPAPSPTAAPTSAPASSTTATPSPIASRSSGEGGRIELAADRIALTLPDGWLTVDLTGDDFDMLIDAFPDGTFTDEQVRQMRTAMAAGMRLIAFDTEGTGSNVNLVVQGVAVPMSLLEVGLPAQLEALPGISNLDIRRTQALGEEALLATYDFEMTLANGSTGSASGTQLYVAANERLYVVTVTLFGGADEDAQAVFDSLESLP